MCHEKTRGAKSEKKHRRRSVSEPWDEHGGEPDDEVVGQGALAGVLGRGLPAVAVGDVHPAERARPLAEREPPVDAVPVEGVLAREPPGGLAGADPREADAALLAGRRMLRRLLRRRRLDAEHLGDVGEEVAHDARVRS
uniref:Uncharacterized protein n=1 Tax=Triticum urartu TaxID=4572 RepID=A0A8R7TCG8_TRIUA